MVNWVAVAPAQSQLIEALRRIRVAIRLLVIGYLFIVLSMFGFYITGMEAFYHRGCDVFYVFRLDLLRVYVYLCS